MEDDTMDGDGVEEEDTDDGEEDTDM